MYPTDLLLIVRINVFEHIANKVVIITVEMNRPFPKMGTEVRRVSVWEISAAVPMVTVARCVGGG